MQIIRGFDERFFINFNSISCLHNNLPILQAPSQKNIESVYQNLLQRLDMAIGGKIQQAVYDESMDAAVTSKQGGYVKIKSEIGKGTIVQLYLSR